VQLGDVKQQVVRQRDRQLAEQAFGIVEVAAAKRVDELARREPAGARVARVLVRESVAGLVDDRDIGDGAGRASTNLSDNLTISRRGCRCLPA